jgi:hypothetical protein
LEFSVVAPNGQAFVAAIQLFLPKEPPVAVSDEMNIAKSEHGNRLALKRKCFARLFGFFPPVHPSGRPLFYARRDDLGPKLRFVTVQPKH